MHEMFAGDVQVSERLFQSSGMAYLGLCGACLHVGAVTVTFRGSNVKVYKERL